MADGDLNVAGAVACASVNVAGGGAVAAMVGAQYSPTPVDVANAGTMDLVVGRYLRVGDMVMMGVTFRAAITASATLTQVRVPLPVASNFDNLRRVSGAGTTDDSLGGFIAPVSVVADPTNDAVLLSFLPGTGGNLFVSFTAFYVVL